jgi:hypothetical protein
MTPTEKPTDSTPGRTAEQEATYCSVKASVEWLSRQPGSFFRPYAGKWIGVRDCQIVAVADNDRELMAQIKAADLPTTLVHRVERPVRVIYSPRVSPISRIAP